MDGGGGHCLLHTASSLGGDSLGAGAVLWTHTTQLHGLASGSQQLGMRLCIAQQY